MTERLDLHRLAHEVVLPTTVTTELTPWLGDLFERGCRSVLLG